jgi:hypothetical protein
MVCLKLVTAWLQDWKPAVVANWKLWIPFQFVNFLFVPQQLQVPSYNSNNRKSSAIFSDVSSCVNTFLKVWEAHCWPQGVIWSASRLLLDTFNSNRQNLSWRYTLVLLRFDGNLAVQCSTNIIWLGLCLQVAFANVVALAWNVYLSFVSHTSVAAPAQVSIPLPSPSESIDLEIPDFDDEGDHRK